MDKNFRISSELTSTPSNKAFILHEHNDYELYLFLEGDASYIVEGITYDLKPYDMIIIRKNQMHRVYHKSIVNYRRFVVNILPDFFKEYHCEQYEEQFLNTSLGSKIPADTVLSSGIYDTYLQLKKYTDNFSDTESPVVSGMLIQLLYLINKVESFSKAKYKNNNLNKLISYINNYYTEDITLDALEQKFYISKYHLCRRFHKITGMTVHRYITKKRLTLVHELLQHQDNLSEAATRAGFGTYTSFYRAYIREYGVPPKFGRSVSENK